MDRDLAMALSGFSTALAMLIHELDKAGSIDMAGFCKLLRRSADDAENATPESMHGVTRLDLLFLRRVADMAEGGPDPAPGPAWKPTLVQGGRIEGD